VPRAGVGGSVTQEEETTMRWRLVGLVAVVAVSIAVAAVPGVPEEVHWRWSLLRGGAATYQSYLASWPDGRHTAEARRVIEEHAWAAARATDTPEGLTRYLDLYPSGEHASEARDGFEVLLWETAVKADTVASYTSYLNASAAGEHASAASDRIEALRWEAAAEANTIASYRAHVEAYPRGRFAADARARQASLRSDDAPFTRAAGQGTRQAFEAFLRDFPGHRRTADARAALRDVEGRDIVDLIREKKIEVETSGSGIQSVSLRIRRLVAYPVTVRVPLGTFFIAGNQTSQNMVSTEQGEHTLASGGWVSVSVAAACANRPRGIPGADDSFAIQRSPEQAELARLMPVLDKAGGGYAVKQAAVWIVTDDPSYAALGILVRGFARVIREAEAARAMQLYEQAGMDIRNKAIWRDRQSILRGLEDGALKRWLESRLSET
jgi:hypothetical protein